MTERVDKKWFEKGLETYPVDAIFGTLGHYGVTIDEPGFRALAAADFPLSIAATWHEGWKGTGQFSHFPAAAAEELWRRLMAPELAPTDLTLVVIKLLQTLEDKLEGKPDDLTLDTRFTVVEALLGRLPPEAARREKFLDEALAALGEYEESLDAIAGSLAHEGHGALADRMVAIEEALIPVRAGSAAAVVKAARGDEAGAVADLVALSDDAARGDYQRLAALDALLTLERFDDVRRGLVSLLDKAQQGRDVELASHVVEQLTALLEAAPALDGRSDLRKRVEALADSLGEP